MVAHLNYTDTQLNIDIYNIIQQTVPQLYCGCVTNNFLGKRSLCCHLFSVRVTVRERLGSGLARAVTLSKVTKRESKANIYHFVYNRNSICGCQ